MESVREAPRFPWWPPRSGPAQTHVSSKVDPCADSLTLFAENLALCAGNLAESSHLRAIDKRPR
jgi:hypothetical protein